MKIFDKMLVMVVFSVETPLITFSERMDRMSKKALYEVAALHHKAGVIVATDKEGNRTTQVDTAKIDTVILVHPVKVLGETPDDARNQFREIHGPALAKVRKENPEDKVEVLCNQFGNC